MADKTKLIVIAGPTASGKSSAAVELCHKINGEIVSADSMQLYRHMDIGTAKPTAQEMQGIPHHLIDVLEPDEPNTVAVYTEMAKNAIEDIARRGKPVVLCGGTGLYIDALIKPMRFSVESNDEIRNALHAYLDQYGKHALHERLRKIDLESAARLHENDTRRVIRAIEIYEVSGITLTEHNKIDAEQGKALYDAITFAFTWPRDVLYDRINCRVDAMIEKGLVEEVRTLANNPGFRNATAMQAIGYKEICAYLDGKCSLDYAIETIKAVTRGYAKKQMTWFTRDKNIIWLENEEAAIAKMMERIGEQK